MLFILLCEEVGKGLGEGWDACEREPRSAQSHKALSHSAGHERRPIASVASISCIDNRKPARCFCLTRVRGKHVRREGIAVVEGLESNKEEEEKKKKKNKKEKKKEEEAEEEEEEEEGLGPCSRRISVFLNFT